MESVDQANRSWWNWLFNSVKLTSKEACENCRSFSLRNHRSSTVTRLWFYLKNGRRWSNKNSPYLV